VPLNEEAPTLGTIVCASFYFNSDCQTHTKWWI